MSAKQQSPSTRKDLVFFSFERCFGESAVISHIGNKSGFDLRTTAFSFSMHMERKCELEKMYVPDCPQKIVRSRHSKRLRLPECYCISYKRDHPKQTNHEDDSQADVRCTTYWTFG